MDEILASCGMLFDKNPQAFGVAKVILDDSGEPQDFVYEYLNPAMAAMTGQTVDELQGRAVYDMWGGDRTWLNYFYKAAYHDEIVEFDSVSLMIEQFLNAIAFPIKTGYCGFSIINITEYMGRTHFSMENASAGLFFYDIHTHMILLTKSAREQCGLDEAYMDISDFASHVFGDKTGGNVLDLFTNFKGESERSLFEGQCPDGSWLRLSMSHTGVSDRFAYGFLEDFTRTKEAELDSARRMDIIESLSRENFSLYLVDMERNHIEPYRVRDKMSGPLAGVGSNGILYTDYIEMYAENYVSEADRERVKSEISRAEILKRIDEGAGDFSISYKRIFEDGEQYVEMRIIGLSSNDHVFVLAVRNINDEMEEQLHQKEALKNALEVAEHASEAKSAFLTNMSHDFRTPMNSIMGFANIALENLENTDKVEDCLNKIMLSSDHLLDLINDILDVSRIESGKVKLSNDPFNLVDFGNDLNAIFSNDASMRGIDFSISTDRIENENVCADKLRIQQILSNIIGNALKFTPTGGSVEVAIRESGLHDSGYNLYSFSVTDTGCGISKEFVEKIFMPFERDTMNTASSIEGTGLGMTITKSLVDLYGGTIEVESELGAGTTIVANLPLLIAKDARKTSENDPSKESNPTLHFDGYTILIVDDDELSREMMSEILKSRGFRAYEASDGSEAVEMIASSEPYFYDVVVMDMRMPRMGGDEATRVIRAMDREDASTIPIIAATADAFEEGYRRAREAGMTAHITKPINVNELTEILKSCLLENQSS